MKTMDFYITLSNVLFEKKKGFLKGHCFNESVLVSYFILAFISSAFGNIQDGTVSGINSIENQTCN